MLPAPFCLTVAPAHGALLDAFFERCRVYDPVDEDAWRVDAVGLDRSGVDEVFDLGDGDPPGCRHHRIEVSRRLAVDEIAFAVAFPGVDDGEVGDEAAFHDIALAVELAGL